MNDDDLLIILPTTIVLGNIILILLITRSSATFLGRIGWLTIAFLLTIAAWFSVALPYILGLADRASSCLGQVGYPGCRRFEELSVLFNQTLGNLNILLLLSILDIVIVLANWFLIRRPRNTGSITGIM